MIKKTGIKEIAALAGVSIGTVDRVLHNRGDVSQKNKDRILTIINELGYQPNVFAKSLSSKKKIRIAIVIPESNSDNPYWDKPKLGVHQAQKEITSFNSAVILEHFDASDETSFKQALKRVTDGKPDGVVLNPLFKSVALEYIKVFDKNRIPHAFIDVNISTINNLGYFGQDAEQSGLVAARLLESKLPEGYNALILKISKDKVFSQHIESRIKGFSIYFETKINPKVEVMSLEMDLSNHSELDSQLSIYLQQKKIRGIYVPNTRVFYVADYLRRNQIKDIGLIGYDLIEQNVQFLKQGYIDYLISQSPEEQAYKAVMTLFNKLLLHANAPKTHFSPIDIIIKENVDYYIESKIINKL